MGVFFQFRTPSGPMWRGLWELRRAWKSAKEDEREGLGGGDRGEQDWESSRTHPAANILAKGERNHPVPSEILRICKFLESTFSISWSYWQILHFRPLGKGSVGRCIARGSPSLLSESPCRDQKLLKDGENLRMCWKWQHFYFEDMLLLMTISGNTYLRTPCSNYSEVDLLLEIFRSIWQFLSRQSYSQGI